MNATTDLNSLRMSISYRATPSKAGWHVLVAIVVATALAAVAGSVASLHAPEFYAQLTKPSWAPPAWVFGPVWTVLFMMMALAAWLVVKARPLEDSRSEMSLYGVQLVANALWTWLFFRWNMGAAAFAEVLVLFVLVALTARAFYRGKRLSGWLMVPYIVWVAFASVLTYTVWQLNPGTL